MSDQIPPELKARIDPHLFAGRRIEAIKIYREYSGLDLKESKDVIDAYSADLRDKEPENFTVPAPGNGCFGLAAVLCFCALAALGALLLLASACPAQAADAAPKVRIVLAGDSTVTTNGGWGLGFANQLRPEIECVNLARGGRSSKSFRDEGEWQKVLDRKPDYVLIQFGHNDMPGKGAHRETDPATTYHENMARFVDEARAIGAKPILITSMTRRRFKDGRIHSDLFPYVDEVKKLAAEKKVPLVDLHARSIEVFEKIGEDGCKELSPIDSKTGKTDTTHLNAKGGEVVGKLVAEELKKTDPALAVWFVP